MNGGRDKERDDQLDAIDQILSHKQVEDNSLDMIVSGLLTSPWSEKIQQMLGERFPRRQQLQEGPRTKDAIRASNIYISSTENDQVMKLLGVQEIGGQPVSFFRKDYIHNQDTCEYHKNTPSMYGTVYFAWIGAHQTRPEERFDGYFSWNWRPGYYPINGHREISESLRQKGVGKIILQLTEDLFKALGSKKLTLTTCKSGTASWALKNGFRLNQNDIDLDLVKAIVNWDGKYEEWENQSAKIALPKEVKLTKELQRTQSEITKNHIIQELIRTEQA